MMAKEKARRGVRLRQGEGKEKERDRHLNEQGMAPKLGNTATQQLSAETPKTGPSPGVKLNGVSIICTH